MKIDKKCSSCGTQLVIDIRTVLEPFNRNEVYGLVVLCPNTECNQDIIHSFKEIEDMF